MAEERKGSPSQMAVKGLNSTPLPIFPEVQTPSPVPPWREPVPAYNSSTCLPSPRAPCPPLWVCQDTRCISQSPWPGPPAPTGTCPRLRPLGRLKEFLRPSHCWSPDSTLKHILSSLLKLCAVGISLPFLRMP